MWHYYNLPGRFIAELEFLFPRRGQLWASRRRRESAIVHFLYATLFWIVAAIILFSAIGAMLQHA